MKKRIRLDNIIIFITFILNIVLLGVLGARIFLNIASIKELLFSMIVLLVIFALGAYIEKRTK